MYNFKNENCTGGKHSKVCLTVMAADNVNRKRRIMFVIDKSNSSRCLTEMVAGNAD